MIMDDEIRDALAAGSAWRGSPNELWRQVESGIRSRQARRWWTRPTWGAMAVAAVAVAAVWMVRGPLPPAPERVSGVSPPAAAEHGPTLRQKAKSPVKGVKQEAPATSPPAATEQAPTAPVASAARPENPGAPVQREARPSPPPPLYNFTIAPEQEVVAAGGPVRITLRLRNLSGQPMQLATGTPQLFVGPAAEPYDTGNPAGEAIPLPGLAGRVLAPDEELTAAAVWRNSSQPGWYRAVLASHGFQAGPWRGTAGGGSALFLVAYPPGQAVVQTITPNAQSTLHGITLTIRRIEFTERETRVHFHITKLQAPAEFGFVLLRPDGRREGAFLDRSHRDSPDGGIEGVARFNPTPAEARNLIVEMLEATLVHVGQGMERLAGPWRVEIALDGQP